jgi:hypothetical protein
VCSQTRKGRYGREAKKTEEGTVTPAPESENNPAAVANPPDAHTLTPEVTSDIPKLPFASQDSDLREFQKDRNSIISASQVF